MLLNANNKLESKYENTNEVKLFLRVLDVSFGVNKLSFFSSVFAVWLSSFLSFCSIFYRSFQFVYSFMNFFLLFCLSVFLPFWGIFIENFQLVYKILFFFSVCLSLCLYVVALSFCISEFSIRFWAFKCLPFSIKLTF
jgi:hypothetical protein